MTSKRCERLAPSQQALLRLKGQVIGRAIAEARLTRSMMEAGISEMSGPLILSPLQRRTLRRFLQRWSGRSFEPVQLHSAVTSVAAALGISYKSLLCLLTSKRNLNKHALALQKLQGDPMDIPVTNPPKATADKSSLITMSLNANIKDYITKWTMMDYSPTTLGVMSSIPSVDPAPSGWSVPNSDGISSASTPTPSTLASPPGDWMEAKFIETENEIASEMENASPCKVWQATNLTDVKNEQIRLKNLGVENWQMNPTSKITPSSRVTPCYCGCGMWACSKCGHGYVSKLGALACYKKCFDKEVK